MKNCLFSLVFLAFFVQKTAAQKTDWPRRAVLDSFMFSKNWSDEKPGFAVLIVENGQIVYENQRGLADLKTRKKIGPTTRFNIGSISKSFTAQAILLLEERGLLAIADPVSKFLPELSRFGPELTIEKMLSHTSGVPDHIEAIGLRRDARKKELRPAFAVQWLQKLPALGFRPGSDFVYSNTGYMLLAEIVERVSGQKFEDFVAENIFRPLKMDGATVAYSHEKGLPEGISSYRFEPKKAKFKRIKTWDNALGATGVFCSLRDLAAWDANFLKNQLGKSRPELLEKMLEPAVLNDWSPVGYGCGIFVSPFRGEKMIAHSGGWGGFLAQWRHFPDRKLSVLVASNNDQTSPFLIADAICESLLERPEKPFFTADAPPLPLARAAFEGLFLSESNLIRRVKSDSLGLLVSLFWSFEGTRFSRLFFEKSVGDSLLFFKDEKGEPLVFRQKGSKIDGFSWSGGHFAVAKRFYKKLEPPAEPRLFEGRFVSKSPRQKVRVRFSERRKRLELKPVFFLKYPLVALGGSTFLIDGEPVVVRFEGVLLILVHDWVRGLRHKKRR